MAIFIRVQQSKACFYTVLLLALCLLNGLYSQSYNALAEPSHGALASDSHDLHHVVAASEHATLDHGDCGSDSACKIKCAWHCQLSQAVQPLPSLLSIQMQPANQLPVYFSSFSASVRPELGIRPPISI